MEGSGGSHVVLMIWALLAMGTGTEGWGGGTGKGLIGEVDGTAQRGRRSKVKEERKGRKMKNIY